MRLRIRAKFIGILIIAAVLPVVLALVAAQSLGYRYYRGSQGERFETMAHFLANNLSLAINRQLEDLDEWVALSDIHETMRNINPPDGPKVPRDPDDRRIWMEEHWAEMRADEPPLRGLLRNPLSKRLRDFRLINPLFAEILVTNARGDLLGMTGKTSDYRQEDEEWWQRTMALPIRNAHVTGIQFDESAGVYSIDVSYPIYDPAAPEGKPIGVIKGVIDATPLLASLDAVDPEDQSIRQLVLGTGEIVARLSGTRVKPMENSIAPRAIGVIARRESGWLISELEPDEKQLVGFAALHLVNTPLQAGQPGMQPMYVLVYYPVKEALAPIRQQMYIVASIGGLLVLGFACAGYVVAGRKIIDPVEHLRLAVRSVASSVRRGQTKATEARQALAMKQLRQVKTGDEFEALATDFAFMAEKVSGYQKELEQEIASKTAEIHRDLEMAREFQEALMPRSYPEIPSEPDKASLSLVFHHIYRPASSVGGDFFDILKLSDTRAGVFIADVMGHGARSALVTAILRTMLQDFSAETSDPAQFMGLINRHFHQMVAQSNELIFVSAFYMVIDTQAGQVSYASAGHPPPFFADRARGRVDPLIKDLHGNPALGLLPDSQYEKWTKQVIAGDLFMLFTDGLPEAADATGEEFGEERARQAVMEAMGGSPQDINERVMEELNSFIGQLPLPDDVCLLTIEIAPSRRGTRERPQQRKVKVLAAE